MNIVQRLFSMADQPYREFQSSLMPTVDRARVIGVRMPLLRRLAKELGGSAEAEAFLSQLPHGYYEENLLHALFLMQIKDARVCLEQIERFLPYISSWAECDLLVPRCLACEPSLLEARVNEWLTASHPYTVRFALSMRMHFFLTPDTIKQTLDIAASVQSEEYYVNMMAAWLVATALAVNEAVTLPYLTEGRLSPTVHRMAVRKARESLRVNDTCKQLLSGKTVPMRK